MPRWLPMLAAVLVCAAGLLPREAWVLDDALIYQSYARNALSGAGLVYSPGELAEGYSSPLWMLLLVALGSAGLRGLMAAKALGALCGLATCVLVARAPVAEAQRARWLALCVLLAAQPALLWWSTSGMETPLLMLELALAALGMQRGAALPVVLGGALAAVTRPEAPMYLLPCALWLLTHARGQWWTRARLATLLGAMLLPLLAWQLVRWQVYGTVIANSSLAKLGLPADADARGSGLAYLVQALRAMPAGWLVLLMAAGAAARTRIDPAAIAQLGIIGLALLFACAVGGDWMPRARFVVPVLPLMFLFAAPRLDAIAVNGRHLFAAAVALGAACTLYQQVRDTRWDERDGVYLVARWPHDRTPFVTPAATRWTDEVYARYMLWLTRPGDAVVHFDIGKSGYLASDVRIVDQYGLTSRYEAETLHRQHDNDAYAAHLRALSPAVAFVIWSKRRNAPDMLLGRMAWPALQETMVPVTYIEMQDEVVLLVMARRDVLDRKADPARLDRWLAQAPGLAYSRENLLKAPVVSTPQ